eukprot:TRINITY_DN15393_c0_g1_i1.p1 TRINITY_DN15393_c0_g1~~TRINITY_DN15393_c0_g1_i1.p1  ORF type:complete len:118 (-),score=2.68 TRINITY_DN15393_c0_g1_i1:23-376(-)
MQSFVMGNQNRSLVCFYFNQALLFKHTLTRYKIRGFVFDECMFVVPGVQCCGQCLCQQSQSQKKMNKERTQSSFVLKLWIAVVEMNNCVSFRPAFLFSVVSKKLRGVRVGLPKNKNK